MPVKMVSNSCKDVVSKMSNNSQIIVQVSQLFEASVVYIKINRRGYRPN